MGLRPMVNYRADAVIRRLELVELILRRTLGKHDETIKKRRNNMNTVQIMGNLTKDAEVRYTKSGKAVATFTVAASNTYVTPDGETKEQNAFVNCVAWGKQGEQVGQLTKGSKCFVEGRLQTRSYETQDGQKKYVTEVVANFVGAPLSGDTNSTSNFDNFGKDEDVPF